MPPTGGKPKVDPRAARKSERELRKELSTVEKTIARLDEEKKTLNAQLMTTTDAGEALRLHNEVERLSGELTQAEERWCEINEEIEGS